jgi:murein DD-endopeptidase MepM/ murein hydrolase activator NlpD
VFDGLFLVKAKITQAYGANPTYYKKFDLAGHEGVDLVPIAPYWGIHSLEDGVVIVDDDDGDERRYVYGDNCRIQNDDGRIWLYAHQAENCIEIGQRVLKGQLIGVMGSTGGSQGVHVHLSCYWVTPFGARLYLDNGYKGMVDPTKEGFR